MCKIEFFFFGYDVKFIRFLFQDIDMSDLRTLWLSYRQTLCVFPFLI